MRYLTAGESHGEALIGIIEGLPSGLTVDVQKINSMLSLRQNVYGRGERSRLFCDEARILSGLNGFETTGAPIAVILQNGKCGTGGFDFFRPGHVDYAAAVKYGYSDPSLGAERASARETAMRTALGAIAIQLLGELGVSVKAHVTQIGSVKGNELTQLDEKIRCDVSSAIDMKNEIDEAQKKGDTLGGKIKIVISGLIAGIGSHVFYDRRLDGRLSGALMSIPSVKAVENGLGVEFAALSGRQVADERGMDGARKSNNCGGIEGGISNGEDVIFTITCKPVPSICGLNTIDRNGKPCVTGKVRGDVCVVPAACIVAEAVASLEITSAILDCLGGDCMQELIMRYKAKGALCRT